MTYEQAFDWLQTREATLTFVTIGDVTLAVVSALNGSIKGQSDNFLDTMAQCFQRELDFINAGKISRGRTPLMDRILDWHKQHAPDLTVYNGHDNGVVEAAGMSTSQVDEAIVPDANIGFQRRKPKPVPVPIEVPNGEVSA